MYLFQTIIITEQKYLCCLFENHIVEEKSLPKKPVQKTFRGTKWSKRQCSPLLCVYNTSVVVTIETY